MQEKREQAKLEARLRRLCEKKPSGKIQVPEDVHQAWKAGGAQRENIMEIFVNSGCDKVTCVARNFVMLDGFTHIAFLVALPFSH